MYNKIFFFFFRLSGLYKDVREIHKEAMHYRVFFHKSGKRNSSDYSGKAMDTAATPEVRDRP